MVERDRQHDNGAGLMQETERDRNLRDERPHAERCLRQDGSGQKDGGAGRRPAGGAACSNRMQDGPGKQYISEHPVHELHRDCILKDVAPKRGDIG